MERFERRKEGREREREYKRSNYEEPWPHASWRGHGRDKRKNDAGSLRANRREELDYERLWRKSEKVEARRKKVERWLDKEGSNTSWRGRWPEEDPTYVQRPIGRRNFMDGPRSPKKETPKFSDSSPSLWDELKQDLEACRMIIKRHLAFKPLPPKEPSKEEEETSNSSKEEEEKNEERPLHVKAPSSEEPQYEVKEEPSLEGSIKGSPDHQCTTGRASLLDEGSEEEEVASGTTEEEDHGANLSPNGDAFCSTLEMASQRQQEGKEEATPRAPPPSSCLILEDKDRFQGRGIVEDPTPGPQILAVTCKANLAQDRFRRATGRDKANGGPRQGPLLRTEGLSQGLSQPKANGDSPSMPSLGRALPTSAEPDRSSIRPSLPLAGPRKISPGQGHYTCQHAQPACGPRARILRAQSASKPHPRPTSRPRIDLLDF